MKNPLSYDELSDDEKKIKEFMVSTINSLLEGIRKDFSANQHFKVINSFTVNLLITVTAGFQKEDTRNKYINDLINHVKTYFD